MLEFECEGEGEGRADILKLAEVVRGMAMILVYSSFVCVGKLSSEREVDGDGGEVQHKVELTMAS